MAAVSDETVAIIPETLGPLDGWSAARGLGRQAYCRVDWRRVLSPWAIIHGIPVDPIQCAFKPVYFWDAFTENPDCGSLIPKSPFWETVAVRERSAASAPNGATVEPTRLDAGQSLVRPSASADRTESIELYELSRPMLGGLDAVKVPHKGIRNDLSETNGHCIPDQPAHVAESNSLSGRDEGIVARKGL